MEEKQSIFASSDSQAWLQASEDSSAPISVTSSKGSGFWRRHRKTIVVTGLTVIAIVVGLTVLWTVLLKQQLTTVMDVSGSYAIQAVPLDGFESPGGLGLSTSQSLSINGQLYVNNSLVLAPISQPTTAQIGQLYFDRTANGITYYNGSEYLTVANSGQIENLQTQLQSVSASIVSLPTVPSIPSDLATLGADNLFQGLNSFDGGINTGELHVDGVTVLGATTISNLLLSSPLSVGSGGTGTNSLTNNGVLIGQGTSPVAAVTAASAGLCLMSTGGTPVFGVCPGGSFSGVNSINGVNGSLTLNNTTTNGTTLTINDASTTSKGVAQFNAANFVVNAGFVDTIQSITTTSSPTFNSINVNNVAAAGDLTVSAGTNGNLALATSGSGALYLSGYDCSAAGGGGKLTVDAGGKVVCGADNDTPTPGDGEGITSVGAVDSQPKSASGAVIAGSVIYLQTADASNLGLVSTNAQTFAGAKTFADQATFNGGVNVSGDLTVSGSVNTATIAGGSLSATTVNGLAVSSNAISATGALTVTTATNSNLTLAISGGGALYLGGYDCSALAGGGKLTVDGSGRVSCAADTDTDTGLTTIVAGSGIQVVNNNEVSVQLRAGYGLAFDAVSPYGIGLTSCATNQVLKSNGSGWDCASDNDTPTPGDGQGVTTIGSLDGGTANANGASLSADGSTLYLQSASPLRNGLVTTGTQTFAGAKTFNSSVTSNGAFVSTAATGTAPLTVSSTTKVTNLNADLLDGLDSTAFATTSALAGYVQLQSATPGTAQTGNINITGTAIAGDFRGSGADLTALNASQLMTGTVDSARISGSYANITGTGALSVGSIVAGFGSITTANTITGSVINGTVGINTGAGAGVTRLTASGVLQNVTADAAILTTGTLSSGRLTGSYTGISGVGTLTAGVWQGSTVAVQYGGTGASTFTANGIVYGNGSGALQSTGAGTTGQCLIANTSSVPTWGSCGDVTLQGAYTASVGGITPEVKLDTIRGGLDIQDANTSLNGSLLTIRGSNASGLGAALVDVSSTGQAVFSNSTDSTAAFVVQNSADAAVLNVDTLNMEVGIKNGATLVVGDAPITYSLLVATTPLLNAGYNPVSSALTGGASSPSFTELADFNNDGAQDAAVADSGGQIAIYLGTGSTLALGYTLSAPVSNMASTFAVADMDSDGDQDIAVGDYSNNRIAVYKNNGNMTFAAAAFYPAAGGPRSLAIADIDGDGDKDVAVNTYGGAILVLKNSGTGAFGAAVSYTGIAQATQIILRDFDGDSDQDIFVASQYYDGSYHTYALLKNYGDGTYATKTETTIANLYPTEARAADVDNDGDQDVVISNSNGNGYPEIFVLKNNGSGVFTSTSYGSMGNSGQSHISLSDLDGDGDQDVLATYRWDGLPSSQINAYYNNGSGAYNSGLSLVPASSAWMSAATGLDITGDGKTDFFYLNKTSSTYVQLNYTGAPTTILMNSGTGSFVKAYDINKDGAQDIVTVSGSNITVRLKTGPGAYGTATVSNSLGSLTDMDFADFDNDGDIDIISTYNNQISIIKNNGNGTFAAGVAYSIGGLSASDLAVGDMDGDGDLDVVVSATSSDIVSVMLNSGTGTFTNLGVYSTDDGPQSIALADFDKDGNLDVAVTNSGTTNTLSTLRNTGSGALAARVTVAAVSGVTFAETGDFNGDGDQDILLLSTNASNLTMYHNNGSGTFSTNAVYNTITSPISMDVKDIDGDGDKDVVVGSASNISILRNNGSANFGTRSDYLPGGGTSNYPLRPVIADLDGDGDKDVLTSTVYTSSTGNLVAYMNAAGGPSSAPQATGTLSVTTKNATSGGVFIQGVVGQSANLLLIQDAAGNALMALDAQGNLTVRGSILGGIGSPDYAENITASDPTIEAADVVAMDPANAESVVKASKPYDETALGVISTSPGFVTNSSEAGVDDETQRPLALSGRVPVKVTTENGSIMPGDYLTTSSTPGYAMKATQGGTVIGRAMARMTITDSCGDYECGKVLMFIDNSYYSPTHADKLQGGGLALSGDAEIDGSASITGALNVGGLATLSTLNVSGDANIEGELTVGKAITTRTIVINGHIVAGGDKPTVNSGSAAGILNNSSVQVKGSDTTGSIQITTGSSGVSSGTLLSLTFAKSFENQSFNVVVTASNGPAGMVRYHVNKTPNGFQLVLNDPVLINTTYTFDYIVLGTPSDD